MRKFLFSLLLSLLMVGAGAASAKTPDGQPPSVETICDNETGAAFGLCNAYCEAMDCDSPNHRASDAACAQVRRSFERRTGRPMPCEVTCPCLGLLPLFAQIVNGEAEVQMALATKELLSVIVEDGSFAFVGSATPPAFCSVSLEPPFIEITPAEVIACRYVLCRAAAEQGHPCVFPE